MELIKFVPMKYDIRIDYCRDDVSSLKEGVPPSAHWSRMFVEVRSLKGRLYSVFTKRFYIN